MSLTMKNPSRRCSTVFSLPDHRCRFFISTWLTFVSKGVGVERVVRIAANRRCSVSRRATTHCSSKAKQSMREIHHRTRHLRLDDELRRRFRTGKQLAGRSERLPWPDNGPPSYFTPGRAVIFSVKSVQLFRPDFLFHHFEWRYCPNLLHSQVVFAHSTEHLMTSIRILFVLLQRKETN